MESRKATEEELAELALRKREACRRFRERRKAAIKDQEVQAQRMATLIAAEKERQRALLQDQAALAGMAAYQADAVQVLNLGALGERVEGEVALVGDQTWQQLMGMPMSKPEEAAGRASITTQSSAELTSAASAGSGFPAAQHGAHAQQAATTSSGTAATAATEEAARSGSKAGGGGFMQWLYGTVGAAGEAAAPSSGGDVDSLRRKWMQRMVDMTVLDKFWFVFLTEIPSWVMNIAVLGMRLLPKSIIVQRNRAFMSKLAYTLEQWEALPAKRPFFEKIIQARLYDRQYFMRVMARYRPQLLLEIWTEQLLPPPPAATAAGGKPPLHDILLPIARYLEANLSAKQVQALEADWQQYQQQTAAARKLGADSALQLQYNATLHAMSWQRQAGVAGGGSTAERSQAFGSITEDASSLRRFCEEEGLVLLDLQQSLLRVLSPIQAARVTLAAQPFLPDMVAICNYLFTGPRDFAAEKGAVAVAEDPLPAAKAALHPAVAEPVVSLEPTLEPADDALLDLLMQGDGGESLLDGIDLLLEGDAGAGFGDPGHFL